MPATQPPSASVKVARARRAQRRGIALLLVLIIISLGGLLTMRFLQAAGDRTVMSQTLVDSKKAEWLAESGISEASYWLRHPELTGGTAWTGVSARQPDASPDHYDITVTQDATDPTLHHVASQGHLQGPAGEQMARTVSADFRMYRGFAEAVTTPHDLLLPSSATIVGNVYACKSLDNGGRIDGSVWVGSTFLNSGTITCGINLNSAARDIGDYPVVAPVIYTHSGIPYSAEMILTDVVTDPAWQAGLANPMGVQLRSGDLSLAGTGTLDGTLMVTGNLTFTAGSALRATARPGFPALVVKGNLILSGDAVSATINGAVIIEGLAQATGTMPTTRVTINGPLVFPNTGGGFDAAFSSDPRITINYDPARADVSKLYPSQPQPLAGARMVRYRPDGS